MTNNELENKISSALDDMMPKDAFDRISEKIVTASENERTVRTMSEKKTNKIFKFIIPAVAACLLLVAGISGGVFYSNNFAVESVIGIDVNPGIELTVNKNDKVLSASAVNEDGAQVLDGMELKSTDLKVAVNAIIGSMVQHGYVVDENSGILVTVQNDDTAKAAQLQNEICVNIDEALRANNAEASVINQTVSPSDAAQKFASDNNISLGKAVFVLNLVKKDSSLDAQVLAKMSISEIAAVVSERNIDISDIADYDHDDCIWENIADSIEEVNENAYVQEAVSSGNIISAADAKLAALTHACLNAGDVTFVSVEYDCDDGEYEYDIEFVYNGICYEYEVNALTGAIISCEKEKQDCYDSHDCDDDNEHHH